MTTYQPGDRIRMTVQGDDGLPLVRYGFVGSVVSEQGPVVVMLDGELGGDMVELRHIQPVTVCTVELCLHGDDLITDPRLRSGLVEMWRAEADTAGLAVDTLHPMGNGVEDEHGAWVLARLMSGGLQYMVRAEHHHLRPDVVRVHAVRPQSGDQPG